MPSCSNCGLIVSSVAKFMALSNLFGHFFPEVFVQFCWPVNPYSAILNNTGKPHMFGAAWPKNPVQL